MFLSFLLSSQSRTLHESSAKLPSVGLVIGKFSPVTKGHDSMIRRLIAECKKTNSVPIVAVVDVERIESDKLMTGSERKTQLISIYGDSIEVIVVRNAFAAIVTAQEMSRDIAVIVCGSDRQSVYKTMSSKILSDTQQEMPKIVSLDRDPDADDVSGFSSSKARAAVAAGDYNTFATIVAGSSTRKLYDLLSSRMTTK